MLTIIAMAGQWKDLENCLLHSKKWIKLEDELDDKG